MLHFTDAAPTDFWGVVMPAWIGSIGGIISAVIGAWAFINSLSSKRGVKQIAQGLNESAASPEAAALAPEAATQDRPTPVAWTIEPRPGKGAYTLRNASPNKATLTEVTADAPLFRLSLQLPVNVEPQNGVPFDIYRTIGGPTVISVRVRWTESDGFEGSATYFV